MEGIGVLGHVAHIVGKSAASTVAKTSDLLSLQKNSIFNKNEEDTSNFEPLLPPDTDNLDGENTYQDSKSIYVSPLYGAIDPYDKAMTQTEYERLADQLKYSTLSNRGDTMAARDMWKEPRRFRAHLRKISIKNISSTSYSSVFLLISIGGNQTQVQVATLPQEKPCSKMLGYSGKRFFTEPLPLLKASTTEFLFEKECEWRGSYLHLEKENFTIELWASCGFALNKLLGIYQEPLRNIVSTSVDRSATLEQLCNGATDSMLGERSFHILYQFEFQEIYDYELNFTDIRIFPLKIVNTDSFMNEPTSDRYASDVSSFERSRQMECQCSSGLSECGCKSNHVLEEIEKLWQNFQGTPVLTLSIKPSGYNKWPISVSAPLNSENIKFNKALLFRGTSASLEHVNVDISLTDSGLLGCFRKPKYTGVIRLRDIWTSENLPFRLVADKETVLGGSITCSIPFKPKYRQIGRICDIEEDQTYLFLKLIKIDHLYVQGESENIDSFIEVTYNGMSKYSTIVYQSSEPHYQSELIFQATLPDFETTKNFNPQFIDTILFDVWSISVIGCQHEGCAELHLSELENASSQEQTKYYFNRRQNRETSFSANIFSFAKYLILPGRTDSRMSDSILHFELWTIPDIKKAQWYPMLKLYKPIQNIYLEAGCIPSNLQIDLKNYLGAWEEKFENYSTVYYEMRCLALDQRRRLLPYNFFVHPILLPSSQIMTTFACFNFVRTIWYREDSYFPSSYYQWSSPDFILKSKQGKNMYHALLLASLFLGLKIDAFVCIGTPHHEDEEYSWVLTKETISINNKTEKCLRIWDPLSMTVYILLHNMNLGSSKTKESMQEVSPYLLSAIPGAATVDTHVLLNENIEETIPVSIKSEAQGFDIDEADYPFTLEEMHCLYGVSNRGSYKHPAGKTTFSTKLLQINIDSLPFRSLRVVFNEQNVYGFLGSKNSPVTFDFDNRHVWYRLYPRKIDFKTYYAFPNSLSIGTPSYTTHQSIKILYEDIVQRIQTCRFRMSSTTATLWTRDRSLQTYLETGMELIANIDDLDPLCKEAKKKKKMFYEWRLALLSLTPNHHKLRWIYSTFNHINPELIVNHLWNNVSFLKDTDSSRVYTKIMPFDSILTYVALLAVTKLQRLQQRQLTYVSKMYKK